MIVPAFRARLVPGAKSEKLGFAHRFGASDIRPELWVVPRRTARLAPSSPARKALVVTPELIEHHRRIAHELRNEAIRHAVRRCLSALLRPFRASLARQR